MPGSSTASTWSPGRITVESSASSERPFRITEIRREPSGRRRPPIRFPATGESRSIWSSTISQVLLAQLEQVHDPVLGHLVLDEAEHVRGRADGLR